MPDSVVQIEGVGNVQFPGTMSPEEIGAAAHKLYTGAAAQKISANPPAAAGPHVDMQTDMGDAGGKLKGLPGVNPHTPTFQEGKSDLALASLPLAATMSIPQIAGSTLGGAAGSVGGKAIAKNMGGGDTAQEIAGDIGGLGGGVLGGWSGGEVGDAISPNIGAKAKAFGKLGAQEAVSHVPVVGRVVRRPSFGDWIDAARAKAPAVEVPPVEAAAPSGLTPIQQAWVNRGGKLSGHTIERSPRPAPSVPPPGGSIHIEPSPPAPVPAPEIAVAPKPAVNVKPAKVGELLNDSLGGKPLQPNVPLRQQMAAKAPAAVTVPSGHTPVESSAIKSYQYDPATREFQSVTPSGATYIHGDVSPEQVAEFEAADSKGKAFNQLKKNSTYVGKIVNGQRVNAQPPKALASASPEIATPARMPAVGEDLTGILQQSLQAARKRKR